ncbi:MAG TPA: septal ring lytic transglycosylase RlpA family protein [Kiloniellales bacterium]
MTRLYRGFVPAVALLLLLSACARAPDRPADGVTNGAYQAVGVASWYGDGFHGRTTASGEPFDMNALTAAHPSLPFGTMVRVTNLANGRWIVVRINDRGPFKKRRIIDVSRHAAEHLGFLRAGLAKVRVEVI